VAASANPSFSMVRAMARTRAPASPSSRVCSETTISRRPLTEKDLQRARERFRTLVIDPDALAKEWTAQSAPAPCATFPDSLSSRPNLLLGLTRRVSLPERRFQHLRIEAENWSRWPKARRTTCTSPDSGLLDAFSPTRIWKR